MPTFLDLQGMVKLIKETPEGVERASHKALTATMLKAEALAKKNSTQQFTGRNDRRLSGRLLNSIYSGVEKSGPDFVGVLGVRDVPYAAANEFGVTVKPKPDNKMQRLWIPQRKNSGRMTPKEFINLKRARPGDYFLNDKVAGKWMNKRTRRLTPLFFLVKEATIPERPFLRPALEMAAESYPGYLEQYLESELK